MNRLGPRGVFALMALLLPCAGCASIEDVTPDDICRDARRAIGLRTQACTGDAALADARYARAESLGCSVKKTSVGYACSVDILALDCAAVLANGDDLGKWTQSPACDAVFAKGADSGVVVDACTHSGQTFSCQCTIDEGRQPSGTCEPPPPIANGAGFCCKDVDYPQHGSCACQYLSCVGETSPSPRCACRVGALLSGQGVTDCSASFDSAIKACCVKPGGQECYCSTSAQCLQGETPVGACTVPVFCVSPRMEASTCSL